MQREDLEINDTEYYFLSNADEERDYLLETLKRMRENEQFNKDYPYNRKQIIERLKVLIKKQIPYLEQKEKGGLGNPVFVKPQKHFFEEEEWSQWSEITGNGTIRMVYR